MTRDTTANTAAQTETNWQVSYDVEPIRIRDPVAEALAVLDPGDPFVVSYADVVTAAGHSCPTAAGAFRIAQVALDALYPDEHPVRSEIAVLADGPREDPSYGVMGRLLSYITGAAGSEGFGGLAGGHGGRRDLFAYDAFASGAIGPTFRFRRIDTGETVEVTYRVAGVPEAEPGVEHLDALVDGRATTEERAAFREAWHGRVRTVLADDGLFAVSTVEQ